MHSHMNAHVHAHIGSLLRAHTHVGAAPQACCWSEQAVSFEDWRQLDAAEVNQGQALWKLREKALDVPAMLASLRTPVTRTQPEI